MTFTELPSELASTTIGAFQTTATEVLPWVIGVSAILIGAGFAWSRFKKHVAGKKI